MERGLSLIQVVIFLMIAGIIASIVIPVMMDPQQVADTESASPESVVAAESKRPYALDSRRDNWPTLEESTASPARTPQAASNYYVVLDGSGSMSSIDCSGGLTKMRAAIDALRRFVDAVPADANLGLTVFDEAGTSERVPLGTGNREAVHQALTQVRADGGTPLRSSIQVGYDKLVEQGRKQLGYGDYHLVVVTDGFATPEDEDPGEVVGTILANTPVVLHTIGFCIGTEHVLNQPGRSYYVAADSPDQLASGLSAVLAEAETFDATAFSK